MTGPKKQKPYVVHFVVNISYNITQSASKPKVTFSHDFIVDMIDTIQIKLMIW